MPRKLVPYQSDTRLPKRHRRAESVPIRHSLLVGYESEKAAWAKDFPRGEPLKEELADLVERDNDAAEQAYYEAAADPQFVKLEEDRRRYLAQLRRRLRRRR